MNKPLTLMPYMGGKNRLAKWIIEHMPQHRSYIEVFGGSGGVLFSKPRSKKEVYNDAWNDVVHLFAMLRDRGDELKHYLTYTPSSHTLYDKFWKKLKITRDFEGDIERAAALFICLNLSYAGKLDKNWVCRREKESAYSMKNRVNRLELFTDRLREVIIDNLDFEECIKSYDTEEALFYCDPPYYFPPNQQRSDYYQLNFEYRDHRRLAKALSKIRGKALVSYYPCDIVKELYPEDKWFYAEKEVVKQSATVAKGKKKPIGIELLIMNYDPEKVTPASKDPTMKGLQEVFE